MNGIANGSRHDDESGEPLYSAVRRENKTAPPANVNQTASQAPKDPYIAKVYIPDYEEDESKKRARHRDRPIVTPLVQNAPLTSLIVSTGRTQPEPSVQVDQTLPIIPSLSPEQIRVLQTLRFPPGYDMQRSASESDFQNATRLDTPIETPRLFGFKQQSVRVSNGKLDKRSLKTQDSYHAQMRFHNSQRVIQSSNGRNAPEFGDSAEGEVGFHKKKKPSGESQPNSPLYSPAKRGTITSLPVTPTFQAEGGQPMFSNARLFHPQYMNRNSLANSESLPINSFPQSPLTRQPPQIVSSSSWNAAQQSVDSVDGAFARSPSAGRDLRSYAYANTKMYDNSNSAYGDRSKPAVFNSFMHPEYMRNPNFVNTSISTNNY